MIKKIKNLLAGIIIGIVFSVAMYNVPKAISSDWTTALPFTPQQLSIIKQVKLALSTYQVDGDKKDKIVDDKMYYGAMTGLVNSVGDPFTRYVSPETLKEEQTEMEGEYGGLGIYITTREGKTTVITPIENTPADKVGIKPLDEIVRIGDKNAYGMTSEEVVKLLRGEAGSAVKILVKRKKADKLIPFTIVREVIKIKSVRLEMINDIAYIKINQFMLKTDSELKEIMKIAENKKAKGILLDLRNNPGGLLDVCVNVTSQFINKGVVVGMKGRFEKANETLYVNEGHATKLPIVVLVNEGSASAAEILAGAIKDHKRGTIVGMKTFGKGSVQSLFNLPDGSGVYITIARYTTPSGYVIDHKGLEPHVKMSGEVKKNKKEDVQLQKGLSVLKNKIASQGN
ncbi:MAG: S41 family peptidase [Synergistaceae bacterium]